MVKMKQVHRRTRRNGARMKEMREDPKDLYCWPLHDCLSKFLESFDRSAWDGRFSMHAKEKIPLATIKDARASKMSIEQYADLRWNVLSGPGDVPFVTDFKEDFGVTYPELLAISDCPRKACSERPRASGGEPAEEEEEDDIWNGEFSQEVLRKIPESTFHMAQLAKLSVEKHAELKWNLGKHENQEWRRNFASIFGGSYPEMVAASFKPRQQVQSNSPTLSSDK
jgi:hypothetical protein